MVINWDINSKEHTQPELQKYFSDFKLLRPYYYGDYYPLTDTLNMTKDNVWLAYQLNRTDKGDGILLAFRRKDCDEASITVKLKGIDPASTFELTDEDSQMKTTVTGKQLRDGYSLSLKEKPGSALIWYRKIQN